MARYPVPTARLEDRELTFHRAAFLILADIPGRVLTDPAETPIGVVTAFLGAPFFIILLRTRQVPEAGGDGPQRLLVSIGYAGWSPGQLEDEIGRNGWLTVGADLSVIFDTPIEQRYDKALSLLGLQAWMLSPDAGHA